MRIPFALPSTHDNAGVDLDQLREFHNVQIRSESRQLVRVLRQNYGIMHELLPPQGERSEAFPGSAAQVAAIRARTRCASLA